MNTVTIGEAKELSIELMEASITPLLLGEPGLGKSHISENIADHFNLSLRTIVGSNYQGTDITGFPFVYEGKGQFADFGDYLFPLEDTPIPEGKDGWLVFLDEITNTEPDTFKVLMRVINERMVGVKKLHPKVRFIAAGNPAGDRSLGNILPDALVNRMAVLNVKYSFHTWEEWASKNNTPTILIQGIRNSPLLYANNWGPKEDNAPFVSPRSLKMLSDYINKGGKSRQAASAIIGASLGYLEWDLCYYGEDFLSFKKYIDDCLNNTDPLLEEGYLNALCVELGNKMPKIADTDRLAKILDIHHGVLLKKITENRPLTHEDKEISAGITRVI